MSARFWLQTRLARTRVCVYLLGGTCSADCQSVVSQDDILRNCAIAGTSDLRQRPADWQSSIGSLAPARSVLRTVAPLRGAKPFRRFPSGSSRQINNLLYAT